MFMMLTSFVLNVFIVVTTIFSAVSMFIGWDFMGVGEGELSDRNWWMFKFFTIDSNVLIVVCSLIMAILEGKVLWGNLEALPEWVYILKMTGTAAVTLTMMVTICFLAPTMPGKPIALFYNGNLFFHLITPLAAIVSFGFFEKVKGITFANTLYGVIPTALYAVYYMWNIFDHLQDGEVDPKRDWYGFLAAGKKTAPLVVVLICGITWVFTIGLWALNRIG